MRLHIKRYKLLSFILMILVVITLAGCDNGEPDLTDDAEFDVLVEVIDTEEEGLEDVSLELEDTDGNTQTAEATDEKGIYEFLNVKLEKNSEFTVNIDKDGYQNESVDLVADTDTIKATDEEAVLLKESKMDEDITGEGTKEDPYIIYTFSGLEKIMQDDKYKLDDYYELGSDIDASPTRERDYNEGLGWLPIGSENNAFTGYFDGKEYTINDLYIVRPEDSFVGLFASVKIGKISNLNLVNAKIEGKSNVGGITGFNSGEIDNISVSGEISNSDTGGNTGGIIGENDNGTIINCKSDIEIDGNGRDIGGLIGKNIGDESKVEDSSVEGNVYSTNYGERVGGLIGSSSGNGSSVINSEATGSVNGTYGSIGGLIGKNENTLIENCHTSNDIEVKSEDSLIEGAGGLIGKNDGADVTDSSANGNIIGDKDNMRRVGGLIGYNSDSEIIDSIASGNVKGMQSVGGLIGFSEEANIKNCSAEGNVEGTGNDTAGLIANNIGNIEDSNALGEIRGTRFVGGLVANNEGDNTEIKNCFATGDIYGDDSLGGLVANISASFVTIENSYAEGNVFGSDDDLGGLIGINNGADIVNSYAKGNIEGDKNESLRVGGLIGDNNGGKVYNCQAEKDVIGKHDAGGLIGDNEGDIEKSFAEGKVEISGNSAGGLVGSNDDGEINKCYSIGNVTGLNSIGGLVGRTYTYSKVINSYATGNVDGESRVGGLIAYNHVGDKAIVENSYSTGTVSGTEDIGGLVGINEDEVNESYYDEESSGQNDTGKGIPKSTEEMIQQDTFEPEWDFDSIWTIDENSSYPYLQWQDTNIPTPPQ